MAQWLKRNKPLLTIALAASVAFNIGFVASALMRHEPPPQAEELPAEVDGRPLSELLDMTPEQLDRMREERQKLVEQLAPLETKQAELQGQLGRLIDQDQPEHQAISATLGQLGKVQREIQELVIGHHMELRTFLSSEQLREFARLIQPPGPPGRQRRFDGQGPHGPGGGQGGGGRGPGPHKGPPGPADGRLPGSNQGPGFTGAPGIGGNEGLHGNPPLAAPGE